MKTDLAKLDEVTGNVAELKAFVTQQQVKQELNLESPAGKDIKETPGTKTDSK
jgi:hypothetical protein